jgi:hypothetical protein
VATSNRKPRSYAEGVDQARAIIAQGRLADPGEHYPYKRDEATRLLRENGPMGPGDPETGLNGADDDRVRVEDFTSQDIIDRSAALVQTQEAFLRDPGDATKADYDQAKVDLVAARQAHRAGRGSFMNVVGVRARRAGE